MIVAAIVALALTAGWIVDQSRDARFESSSRLLVGPISADRGTLDAAGLLARTYAAILESEPALERAVAGSVADIDSIDVRAVADERSRIIVLIVEHGDPAVPPRVATALADELEAIVTDDSAVDVTAGSDSSGAAIPGQIRTLEEPNRPAQRAGASGMVILVGFGVLGLLVGIGSARLLPVTGGPTVGSTALAAAGVAEIGVIQARSDGGVRRRHTDDDPSGDARPGSTAAPQLDVTAARLDLLCRSGDDYGSLALVAVDDHAVYAQASANLAAALARNGRPVELVAADPGGPRDWESAVRDRVRLRGGGGDDPLPAGAVAIRDFVRDGRSDRLLVIALGPIGTSRGGLDWAAAADRTLLLVRRHRSWVGNLAGTLAGLRSVGVDPVGAVLIRSGR